MVIIVPNPKIYKNPMIFKTAIIFDIYEYYKLKITNLNPKFLSVISNFLRINIITEITELEPK